MVACFDFVAVNVFLSKSMDNTRRGLVLFPTLLYFLFFSLVTLCFVCLIHEEEGEMREVEVDMGS